MQMHLERSDHLTTLGRYYTIHAFYFNMLKSDNERFDRLEALIERGFAALASDIADNKTEIISIKADVADLREEMHTDFADIRSEMRAGFADIRAELKDIRQRIDAVELAVQNISGFAKEIDHLIERVSAIEQHLGLRRNIAA